MLQTSQSLNQHSFYPKSVGAELTSSDFSFNDLNDDDFQRIRKKQSKNQISLDLSFNSIQLKRSQKSLFSWQKLKNLNLNHNLISSKGVQNLTKMDFPFISVLSLDKNQLCDFSLKHLIKGQWKALEVLNLSSNYLTNSGMKTLILGHWTHLKSLFMENNYIGSKGIIELLRSSWEDQQMLYLEGKRKDYLSQSQIYQLESCFQERYPKLKEVYL